MNATEDVPRLSFSPAEAATMLGVCRETVRQMILRRDLPARRVGRRYLIPRRALEPFGEVPTGAACPEHGAGGWPSESTTRASDAWSLPPVAAGGSGGPIRVAAPRGPIPGGR